MKKVKHTGMAFLAALTIGLTSCGPKDTDIQTAVNDKLRDNAAYANITASVTDGVVTLSGNCETNGCDAAAAAAVKPVKGVKEVKSLVSVAPPSPAAAPVEITADEPLKAAVNDAVSSYKGVTASVKDGVITLMGKIKRDDLQNLMMKLNGLQPRKIENQLTIE
jgi:hyperosmotically inducible protein